MACRTGLRCAASSGAWVGTLVGALTVALLAALAAAFSAPAAYAQEPAGGPIEPAPAGDAPAESAPMLETARDAVRTSTVWLARGIDSWFACAAA